MPLKWNTGMCCALAVSTALFIFLGVVELVEWQIPCLYQIPRTYQCGDQCCQLQCGSQPPNCISFDNQPWTYIMKVSLIWAGAITAIMLAIYLTCYCMNKKKDDKNHIIPVETSLGNANQIQEVEMTGRVMVQNAPLVTYQYYPYQQRNIMQMQFKPAKKQRSYRQF